MALTFTPGYSIDPATGQEVVDFDRGSFDDGSQERTAFRFQAEQENDYWVDEYGNTHHRYEQYDGEELQSRLDGVEEFDEYALEQDHYDSLVDYVCGGEANFNALMNAAIADNGQEFIDYWNETLLHGDPALIEEAFEQLVVDYGDDLDVSYEDVSYEDETDDVEFLELQAQFEEFTEACFDHYGEGNYRAATQWAYNNLSSEDIDEYDAAMDHPNPQLRAYYVDQLMSMYQQAQQRGLPQYYHYDD